MKEKDNEGEPQTEQSQKCCNVHNVEKFKCTGVNVLYTLGGKILLKDRITVQILTPKGASYCWVREMKEYSF